LFLYGKSTASCTRNFAAALPSDISPGRIRKVSGGSTQRAVVRMARWREHVDIRRETDMQIIRDLKAEVRDTTAAWHRDRTAKAHGAMTSARSRLALARWLIRAGISIEGAPGAGLSKQ